MAPEPSTIREFHAHVYFEPAGRPAAEALRERARAVFGERADVWHWKLFDRAVGPHPLPMFEIDFAASAFTEVVSWLMLNRGDHVVLVHPDTGHDRVDHRDHPLWMGATLPLKLETLS